MHLDVVLKTPIIGENPHFSYHPLPPNMPSTCSVLSAFICFPPGQDARRIIREIAEGMSFLHMKKTWHGDLKSLNVLLDANDRAKVGYTDNLFF